METRTLRGPCDPAMLPWIGAGEPVRTPARMDKPLRCRPLEGRRDHRSPLRRCFKPRPPRRARLSRFRFRLPVEVEEADPSSGGCPASCPDTYRPTRGHRHVRNWATRDIRSARVTFKNYFYLCGFCRCALAGESLGDGGGRDRAPEQIALQVVNAGGRKEAVLVGVLDALGNELERQRAPDAGDRVHDGGVHRQPDVGDEGAVDLELVEGEAPQV